MIIRVFPTRTSHTPTDNYAFVGSPPLEKPESEEVHISCTFTWDKPQAEYLKQAWAQYYPIVRVGGPAYDDPGNGFTPGLYLKEGITTTSRGCNNHCPFCLVPEREGLIRLIPIQPGRILQDNNILQCPKSHIDKVLDMLSHQHQVELTGGLEASRVTQYVADRIRSLRIKQLFLACDTDSAIKPLQKAIKLLQVSRNKARCYVLLKWDPAETMEHATSRLTQVWEAGAIPFAQLYQPPDKKIEYPLEWTQFTGTWQRPAIIRAYMKELKL